MSDEQTDEAMMGHSKEELKRARARSILSGEMVGGMKLFGRASGRSVPGVCQSVVERGKGVRPTKTAYQRSVTGLGVWY